MPNINYLSNVCAHAFIAHFALHHRSGNSNNNSYDDDTITRRLVIRLDDRVESKAIHSYHVYLSSLWHNSFLICLFSSHHSFPHTDWSYRTITFFINIPFFIFFINIFQLFPLRRMATGLSCFLRMLRTKKNVKGSFPFWLIKTGSNFLNVIS